MWGQGRGYVGTIFNQQNRARSTAYLCSKRERYTLKASCGCSCDGVVKIIIFKKKTKKTAIHANLSPWGMNLLMHSCILIPGDPQSEEQLRTLQQQTAGQPRTHVIPWRKGQLQCTYMPEQVLYPTTIDNTEMYQSRCTYNIRPNRSCTPLLQTTQKRISRNVLIIYARIGLVSLYDRQHRNLLIMICLTSSCISQKRSSQNALIAYTPEQVLYPTTTDNTETFQSQRTYIRTSRSCFPERQTAQKTDYKSHAKLMKQTRKKVPQLLPCDIIHT